MHTTTLADSNASNEAVFTDPELLNSLHESGIPPHDVFLKVGAIYTISIVL
jgi:hypothetical protein